MSNVTWDEDECLPLSGVQHIAFCRRQFALIHVERQWVENTLTFEGRAIHDRAHDPFYFESRGAVLVSRSVPLLSRSLGLYGVADVVEFRLDEGRGVMLPGRDGRWQPFPVEYKRGRPKSNDCDSVHLCAQAMCLEEMLQVVVPEGALYYGRTRRRETVQLDQPLRERVADLAQAMHSMYDEGYTPPPVRTRACKRCSLEGVCLPRVASRKSVRRYVKAAVDSWRVCGEETP